MKPVREIEHGMGRTPRALDVAAAAGVSTATVSRTFNAPEKVAPVIRERVLAAAASLGWMAKAEPSGNHWRALRQGSRAWPAARTRQHGPLRDTVLPQR